ncbi:MAG: two-component sensor histidine kinase [Firmicutes bacterium]|nr:two-component sensor histidine kinase [Bacillota bacterium]
MFTNTCGGAAREVRRETFVKLNTNSPFASQSFRFQIIFIITGILLVPVLVMLYDILFASKEDEVLFLSKEERLGIIVQNLVRDIDLEMAGSGSRLGEMGREEKISFFQDIFTRTAGPVAEANPGVRLGLYLTDSEEIMVQGFLHNYRQLSPAEEKEREKRILNEAHAGIIAVMASGTPLSRLTSTFDDQVIESLVPVVVNGNVTAVVWADERLHPIFMQSRNFRVFIRYVAMLGFFFGCAGALYVIHNLAGEVEVIKKGLNAMEKDIHNLLPEMPGEMGQVAGAINKMARALAEKEKLEAELQRSERLAALGRLVTGVAHELRNPAAVIKATVQVMEKEFEMIPGVSDYSTVIKEQVDRQNRVIKELLDFGRPGTPDIQQMSVNSLLQGVLTFTEPMLRQQKIKLVKKLAAQLVPVEVDGERIKQVFVNLILNAVQAMPEGGELTIRTMKDGGYVKVEFADTGEGIAEEDLPSIFDPFYTTKDAGTGLGLSISHQIVKAHGGFIDVASVKSEGTVFTVNLPVAGAIGGEENGTKNSGC